MVRRIKRLLVGLLLLTILSVLWSVVTQGWPLVMNAIEDALTTRPIPRTPTPGPVIASTRVADLTLAVSAVYRYWPGMDRYTPVPRLIDVIMVDVRLTNAGRRTIPFSLVYFVAEDRQGRRVQPGYTAIAKSAREGLEPGETMHGQLGFPLPSEADLVRLIYDAQEAGGPVLSLSLNEVR